MSILQPHIRGARVIDLFAGSGALGLEALSRGAVHADFVETDRRTAEILSKNVENLEAAAITQIHRADALRFAERLPAGAYDLAFADPPYTGGAAERMAEVWLATPFASILSVEHDARTKLPGGFDSRRYGTSAITFFKSEG